MLIQLRRRGVELASVPLCLCGSLIPLLLGTSVATAQVEKLVSVQRITWPAETHCLEMFSAITGGPDGRVYAGTCNGVKIGAKLISLDPKTGKQDVLADMQEVCGEVGAKTFPQSKIHSQICFDQSGIAWLGTHSYDWNSLDQYQKSPTDYSGGHLVTYDPRTKKATDLGVLVPHESIMSLALAESVGKVYCVLHPTGRFVVYDIATKKMTDKGAILGYPSRTTVALKDGRGFTFSINGDVVRYLPQTDKLEKLDIAVPLFAGDTDRKHNNPFALAISADEKRIYGTGWTSGLLFEYLPDDGPQGSIRSLGPAFGDDLVPGTRKDLCIAMTTGKDGRIYYAGYGDNPGRVGCYDPTTGKRSYVGRLTDGAKPPDKEDWRAAGAMCTLPDGTLVVADFNGRETRYNLFDPKDVK
jgi:sugar lactone lactonase YvrE